MPKRRRSESDQRKEEIAEDWCFDCKDGGRLIICDDEHCLKAYHPDCVGKDDSFMEADNHWTCALHDCFICHARSNVLSVCLCCPKAMCGHCIGGARFVSVRGNKGFCSDCLKLVLLIEQKLDVASNGVKVDFRDRETYEGLFREYWEIINKKEGLTLEDLQSANTRMRKEKHISSSDSEKIEDNEADSDFDCTENIWKKKPNHRRNALKCQKSGMKRKETLNREEPFGWGSKNLIQFLEAIGINVSKVMTRSYVTTIIHDYISEKKLFHPQIKRLVVCDSTLQSLLRQRTMKIHKIYDFLEPHFVENLQSSEEDETGNHSKDKNDNYIECKQHQISGKKTPMEKEVRLDIPQQHYVSIVPENINLVYLRVTLIQKLLEEQPETFESKVIGSFVRVKLDQSNSSKKNSHQLIQVAGVTKNLGDANNVNCLLKVSGTSKDIRIEELSDNSMSKEECEELKLCIKGGLLKHPTVAELKEKAMSLHEDITKHRIATELLCLQNRIDHANEKGWRSWLYFLLGKKETLLKPEEQARLLEKLPNPIAAEVEELEFIYEEAKDDKQGSKSSPEPIPANSSETPCHNWVRNVIASGDGAVKEYSSGYTEILSANGGGIGQEKDEDTAPKISGGDQTITGKKCSSRNTEIGTPSDGGIGQHKDENSAARNSPVRAPEEIVQKLSDMRQPRRSQRQGRPSNKDNNFIYF